MLDQQWPSQGNNFYRVQLPVGSAGSGLFVQSQHAPGIDTILVMVDLFSRFAFAVPTKDQTTATTARTLWAHVFQPFGCPESVLTTQGRDFEAGLTQHLCALYGCRKIRTTLYRLQGNGACERMNQTVLKLLNALGPTIQDRWDEH